MNKTREENEKTVKVGTQKGVTRGFKVEVYVEFPKPEGGTHVQVFEFARGGQLPAHVRPTEDEIKRAQRALAGEVPVQTSAEVTW